MVAKTQKNDGFQKQMSSSFTDNTFRRAARVFMKARVSATCSMTSSAHTTSNCGRPSKRCRYASAENQQQNTARVSIRSLPHKRREIEEETDKALKLSAQQRVKDKETRSKDKYQREREREMKLPAVTAS